MANSLTLVSLQPLTLIDSTPLNIVTPSDYCELVVDSVSDVSCFINKDIYIHWLSTSSSEAIADINIDSTANAIVNSTSNVSVTANALYTFSALCSSLSDAKTLINANYTINSPVSSISEVDAVFSNLDNTYANFVASETSTVLAEIVTNKNISFVMNSISEVLVDSYIPTITYFNLVSDTLSNVLPHVNAEYTFNLIANSNSDVLSVVRTYVHLLCLPTTYSNCLVDVTVVAPIITKLIYFVSDSVSDTKLIGLHSGHFYLLNDNLTLVNGNDLGLVNGGVLQLVGGGTPISGGIYIFSQSDVFIKMLYGQFRTPYVTIEDYPAGLLNISNYPYDGTGIITTLPYAVMDFKF
jgi:hypothetical protein